MAPPDPPIDRVGEAPAAVASLFSEARAALRKNVPALDGLRGVAILAVLAHQLCIDGYAAPRFVSLALLPFQAGWVGVQLFFVLSGFLITGILLDTRSARNFWSSFFARRALRIFPVYYVLLILTFVVAPAVLSLSEATLAENRHQAWYWLYLANVPVAIGAKTVTVLGHCWSLSVEEQFYLVWPLVVRFAGERRLAIVCVVIATAALALRVVLRAYGADPEIAYELTPARADALALGALAAVAIRRREWIDWIAPRLPRLLGAASLMLAGVAIAGGFLARVNVVTQTIGYAMIAIVSALLILQTTVEASRGHGRIAAIMSAPILRAFGRYSYAIYVFHLPIHLYVERTFLAPRLATLDAVGFLALQSAYFVVGSFALLALGAISYRVVERPFLAAKRYFTAVF